MHGMQDLGWGEGGGARGGIESKQTSSRSIHVQSVVGNIISDHGLQTLRHCSC